MVKTWRDPRGYEHVTLRPKGKPKKRFAVHALVAAAHLGLRPEGHVIRHVNGNPGDNRAANLAYGTQSENKADEVTHGTKLLGEKLPWAKLTRSDVIEVKRLLADGARVCEIVLETGVSRQCVSSIKAGRSWRHVG